MYTNECINTQLQTTLFLDMLNAASGQAVALMDYAAKEQQEQLDLFPFKPEGWSMGATESFLEYVFDLDTDDQEFIDSIAIAEWLDSRYPITRRN